MKYTVDSITRRLVPLPVDHPYRTSGAKVQSIWGYTVKLHMAYSDDLVGSMEWSGDLLSGSLEIDTISPRVFVDALTTREAVEL